MRTLLRPTGFVDSPFSHDGKVVRLAGGLNWFSAVELIVVEGSRRVSMELVPVEGIESRFDDDMAAQWSALAGARPPLQLGERTIRLDQPQVMGIVNVTPDSFSDGGQFADASAAAEAGAEAATRTLPMGRSARRSTSLRRSTRSPRRSPSTAPMESRAPWSPRTPRKTSSPGRAR